MRLEKLSAFVEYAKNRGFFLFLLPVFERVPNVNAYITDQVRSRLLVRYSSAFSEEKKEEWRQMLESEV